MARRVAREMTVEEFDAWSAARRRTEAVAKSADEDGGPRLSARGAYRLRARSPAFARG